MQNDVFRREPCMHVSKIISLLQHEILTIDYKVALNSLSWR